MSGETSEYTRWAGGEPNDSGGNEDCGQLIFYPYDGNFTYWNDGRCGNNYYLAIIELEELPAASYSLTIVDSFVTDNSAGNSGGGIWNGEGSTLIDTSIVSNNRSANNGGGYVYGWRCHGHGKHV